MRVALLRTKQGKNFSADLPKHILKSSEALERREISKLHYLYLRWRWVAIGQVFTQVTTTPASMFVEL
jgi:hypothetical protein